MESRDASSTSSPQPLATPGAVVQPSCFPLTLKRQWKIPEIIYLSLGRAGHPFICLSKSKYTQESRETKRTGPKLLSCAHRTEGRLRNHWALPTWHVNEESVGCRLPSWVAAATYPVFFTATSTSQDSSIAEKSLPNFLGGSYQHPSRVSVTGKQQKAQVKTLLQLSQIDIDSFPRVSPPLLSFLAVFLLIKECRGWLFKTG